MLDRTEFARLTEQYMDTVYAIAVNNCRNPADAEDIVQNTFLKLLYTDEIFETDENVKRWLIRVTVNETHSLFRSAWKRHVVYKTDSSDSLDDSSGGNPSELVSFSEEERALYEAMHVLPEDYRTVIHLFYFEEYSTGEIAGILEISEAAVRKRLSRGRKRLRNLLEQ